MTLLHIIASPHVYARLRAEIDSTEAAASGTIITDAEARKLPYLQAVIIEGIRYWPPISLLASKIVPKGGATINDFFLPEGISIGQSIMGIERSKDIFGEDADQYRPERWLNFGDSREEKARERKMRSTVDLVFASGKYTCPGRPVAMIELNKIYVEVRFRFSRIFVLGRNLIALVAAEIRYHFGKSLAAVDIFICWRLAAEELDGADNQAR